MKKKFSDLRKIFTFARPELHLLAIGFFFLLISSSITLYVPKLIQGFIDHSLTQTGLLNLKELVIKIAILLFVAAIAGAFRYYFFTISGERTVKRIREVLFKKLMSLSVDFFDQQKTGDLMSRLTADCTKLQSTVSVNLSMLFRNLAIIVGGLVMMFTLQYQLSLGILLLIPPMLIGAILFGKKLKIISKKTQDSLAMANSVADESLSEIRTIKSFASEETDYNRFKDSLEQSYQWASKRIGIVGVFVAVFFLIGYLALCLLFYFGGQMVVTQELSTGDLTSFVIYMSMVGVSAATVGSLWTDYMAASGAATRVFELLDLNNPKIEQEGTVPFQLSGALDFKNISFSYPARPDSKIFNELTLSLKPNQVTALVGGSGSGKSTIAHLIQRFYDVDQGDVLLDGVSYENLDLRWLRKQVGVVKQEPSLFSMSIRDNLKYGLSDMSEEQMKKACQAAFAHDFISEFPEGYDTLVGERGVQLSGGQKQRIAIARAILKNPKILILDEATSALDSESESLVQKALDHLMKNRTTLVIAHRLSTIKKADVIVVLDKGAVVQSGKHESLVEDKAGQYWILLQKQLS